jgi:hypothetical protein
MKILFDSRSLPFMAALFVPLLFNLQAQGRIYVVTDTNDTAKITSLRGAVIDANRIGGNNTIMLGRQSSRRNNQQPVFHLTLSGANEDGARTGDLDVTRGSLTIIGATNSVTIDATGLGDRVFQILPHARLTLENITITGGTAPQAEFGSFYSPTRDAEKGGAIDNAGILTLKNCVITNNSSGGGNGDPGNGGGRDGGDGGGIYNSGSLTVDHCIVAGNSSGAGFDGAYGGNGGGIKNDGTCFLTDSIVSRNQSGAGGGPGGNAFGFGGFGGNGGGIFNSGTMVLSQCVISANVDGSGSSGGNPGIATTGSPGGFGGNGGSGAGVYNVGQMQLNFSAVYDNISGNGGSGGSFGAGGNAGMGGNGAGIYNAGKLSLNTSTISGNSCGNGGAGGNGFFGGGAAGGGGGSGGGIYNAGSIFIVVNNQFGFYSGSLDLTSCTIALNQTGTGGKGGNGGSFLHASAASGGQGGDGGGILNGTSSTNVTVRNTLIALNLINVGGAGGTNTSIEFQIGGEGEQTIGDSGPNGLGFDVGGDFISQGYNLISVADGSTGFVNGVNADQVGSIATPIDPLIGLLQMNGGSTPTHALLSGSPAIDQGNSFAMHTDQRGYHRPYDFPSISNAQGGDGSDIGAFELDANQLRSFPHFAR